MASPIHARSPESGARLSPDGKPFPPSRVTPGVSDEIPPAIKRLRTVCRCNNIKHGTIEKVICGGATTVAEVARLTTATTGQCGGSCTPEVVTMIDEIHGTTTQPAEPALPGEEDAWWAK